MKVQRKMPCEAKFLIVTPDLHLWRLGGWDLTLAWPAIPLCCCCADSTPGIQLQGMCRCTFVLFLLLFRRQTVLSLRFKTFKGQVFSNSFRIIFVLNYVENLHVWGVPFIELFKTEWNYKLFVLFIPLKICPEFMQICLDKFHGNGGLGVQCLAGNLLKERSKLLYFVLYPFLSQGIKKKTWILL